MKRRASDILTSVNWMDFSNRYFEHSSSWFYHKMDGVDGNGGKGGFSPAETERLRSALYDLSARIRRVADTI